MQPFDTNALSYLKMPELVPKDEEIIKECLKNNQKAQEALYNRYAPKMLSVCYRYATNIMEAEDILHDAFVRMFNKLHLFNGTGQFESWLRRLVVNSALNHIEAQKKFNNWVNLDELPEEMPSEEKQHNAMFEEDLLQLIKKLPDGYRTIFNLYVIDGYTHPEIAAMLKISENTSKSQLSRARSFLKKRLEKKEEVNETIYR